MRVSWDSLFYDSFTPCDLNSLQSIEEKIQRKRRAKKACTAIDRAIYRVLTYYTNESTDRSPRLLVVGVVRKARWEKKLGSWTQNIKQI